MLVDNDQSVKRVTLLYGSLSEIFYNEDNKVTHIQHISDLSTDKLNQLLEEMTLKDFLFELDFLNIAAIGLETYAIETFTKDGLMYTISGVSNKTKARFKSLIEESGLFTSTFKGEFKILNINSSVSMKEECERAIDDEYYEGCDYSTAYKFDPIRYVLKTVEERATLRRFSNHELSFHTTDDDGRTRLSFRLNFEDNLKGLIELSDLGFISITSIARLIASRLERLESMKEEYERAVKSLSTYTDFYEEADPSIKLLIEMEKKDATNRRGSDAKACCDGC